MTDPIELIGDIYDAAFDAALWPDVLIRLADTLGGAEVCMFNRDPRAHAFVVLAPRHDPHYVQAMRDEWLQREFEASRAGGYGQRLLGAPAGQILDAHTLVPDGFLRTDFYNEWWRPQRLSLFGVGLKWRVENELGFCFVHGSSKSGGIKQAKLFNRVAPHLLRAAELQHRLWRTKLQEMLALTRPSAAHDGVVFVDAAARVVHADDTAADLICARAGLLLHRSELTTVDSDASALLRRLIAGCADRRLAEDGSGGAVTVRRPNRLPLHILVAPVPAQRLRELDISLGVRPPVAILVIKDPEREKQICVAYLREELGLTPAEAEVALEIGKGDGRSAAAARLGITSGTVRIHLEHIFQKVGVHRQAELVRLLADTRRGRALPN
jgi:DNA-binding CsgD family transcriptional regulator